jgi:hypothetical protein
MVFVILYTDFWIWTRIRNPLVTDPAKVVDVDPDPQGSITLVNMATKKFYIIASSLYNISTGT